MTPHGQPRRQSSTKKRLIIRSLAAAAVVGTVVAVGATPSPSAYAEFAAGAFNAPVAADAPLDPNSTAMVARLARENAMYANLVDFGVPIYTVGADTPRHQVQCTQTSWGPCPFQDLEVPIPDDAAPNRGSDGAMVVVDESSRTVYEFWQARHSGGQWSTSWGAVNSLDGTGWGGNSTGSGASRLAGVIRVAEIAQGNIPHALVIQSDNVCAGVVRPPALKTDGTSSRPDCIPEGARIRLDPAVDLATLKLSPAARTVAQALQVYGAYVIDVGRSPMSVSFERDTGAGAGAVGTVYQNAGLRWDYDGLPGIPYDRLQVLA